MILPCVLPCTCRTCCIPAGTLGQLMHLLILPFSRFFLNMFFLLESSVYLPRYPLTQVHGEYIQDQQPLSCYYFLDVVHVPRFPKTIRERVVVRGGIRYSEKGLKSLVHLHMCISYYSLHECRDGLSAGAAAQHPDPGHRTTRGATSRSMGGSATSSRP